MDCLVLGFAVIYSSSFFGDELWPADKLVCRLHSSLACKVQSECGY